MTKVKKATKAKKTTSTKSKKSVAKKVVAAAPVVAAPVVAAPVAAAPVVAAPVAAAPTVPTLTESFQELLGQLQALRSQLTSVTGHVRALQKRADRELKNAQQASKKRQRRTGNRAPSGFVKPTKISLELANFLGKPKRLLWCDFMEVFGGRSVLHFNGEIRRPHKTIESLLYWTHTIKVNLTSRLIQRAKERQATKVIQMVVA